MKTRRRFMAFIKLGRSSWKLISRQRKQKRYFKGDVKLFESVAQIHRTVNPLQYQIREIIK